MIIWPRIKKVLGLREVSEADEVSVNGVGYDSQGNAYTYKTAGTHGDPWYGATILMPWVIQVLKEAGEWPLSKHPPVDMEERLR